MSVTEGELGFRRSPTEAAEKYGAMLLCHSLEICS